MANSTLISPSDWSLALGLKLLHAHLKAKFCLLYCIAALLLLDVVFVYTQHAVSAVCKPFLFFGVCVCVGGGGGGGGAGWVFADAYLLLSWVAWAYLSSSRKVMCTQAAVRTWYTSSLTW